MSTAEDDLSSRSNKSQAAQALERLHEDEALTDALDDKGAKALLTWGEKYIRGLDLSTMTTDQFQNAIQKGMSIMRSVNRINSQRMDLSDEGFIQQIAGILDIARLLNH
ncbi:MAG: hypothetical protein WCI88_04975 [Chloroflexota bacterium]